MVLRLRDEAYTPDLSDPLSNRFKSLAGLLETNLTRLYKDVPDVRDVNVVAFRCVRSLFISVIIALFNSEIEIIVIAVCSF